MSFSAMAFRRRARRVSNSDCGNTHSAPEGTAPILLRKPSSGIVLLHCAGRGSMLSGKRVLVTAASAGLGRACAERLAAEGCRLAISARERDRLDEAAASMGAVGIA